MAIYHLHMKIITRGVGKSAVAAAAYRSGETLKNEFDGELHDYTRKGGIVHTEILLPANAPAEYSDRNTLWNAVEKIEKQCNSQLAREVEVALPVELTMEQNISLLRGFVKNTFVDKGMIADIAVHIKKEGNPHAHIMLTMRPFKDDKTWGAKIKKVNGKPVYTTDWNGRNKAEEWRSAWADAVNGALAINGHSGTVVDHRSYARQGVDKIPSIHLGVSATQMERKGIATDRGNTNRNIAVTNSQLRQTRARIDKVLSWANSVKADTPPTLYEVLNAILNPSIDKSLSKTIADLKLAADTLLFIQQNGISDLPALADKVAEIRNGFNGIRGDIKKAEARIKKLENHIGQCDNFLKYRKAKMAYDRMAAEADSIEKSGGAFAKTKAEKARQEARGFYRDHASEIEAFKGAEKYLGDTLQGRYEPKNIPAQRKKWQGELETKKAERGSLSADCRKLTDELSNAEKLKKFTIKLMLSDEAQQERQKAKTKEEIL
jgi:hypothetical protein